MNQIKISQVDLAAAASRGLLRHDQAQLLWQYLHARKAETEGSQFNIQHLLWYGGAGVVLVAMSWFLGQVWDLWNGAAILATAVTYAAAFLVAGVVLLRKTGMKTPSGLLVTLAVSMTPLAVFGIERMLGMWSPGAGSARDLPYIRDLLMEGATIGTGLLALRYMRFSFLTAPIAFGAWLATLDLTGLIAGVGQLTWQQESWVSAACGLVMMAIAYFVDRRNEEDYAFWGYLFGTTAFWGSLFVLATFHESNELGMAAFGLLNLGLMVLSVLMRRKIFVVYGSLGAVFYLGHLAFNVFAQSIFFPLVLTVFGVGIIFLGVVYQKNHRAIEQLILRLVPGWLKRALPPERE